MKQTTSRTTDPLNGLINSCETLSFFLLDYDGGALRHRRGHRRWASNATPDEEAVGELESFSVASLPGFPHPTKVRDGELVIEIPSRDQMKDSNNLQTHGM